jgi:hypothetical protein
MSEPPVNGADTTPQPRAEHPTGLLVFAFLLALAGPLAYLWMIDSPFIRSSGSPAILLITAGLAVALSAARRTRRLRDKFLLGGTVAIAAMFFTGFFYFYRLPPPAAAISQGDAPDFTLDDQTGQAVTLSTEYARGPVLLVFYRGHW